MQNEESACQKERIATSYSVALDGLGGAGDKKKPSLEGFVYAILNLTEPSASS